MTNSTRKTALCVASGVLALACSLPADAQFNSGMGGGGMGGGGMGGGGGHRGGMRNPDAAAAPRDAESARGISVPEALYEARMRLLITPEQTPAWEKFNHAYLGWTALAARPRSVSAVGGGALQSVQEQLTLAQNRYAATEDLAEASKGLVATLTDAQKQVADEVIPRMLGLTSPSGQHVTVR